MPWNQFNQHFMSSFFANIITPKITDSNCKYRKAAQNTFLQESCSQNVGKIDSLTTHPSLLTSFPPLRLFECNTVRHLQLQSNWVMVSNGNENNIYFFLWIIFRVCSNVGRYPFSTWNPRTIISDALTCGVHIIAIDMHFIGLLWAPFSSLRVSLLQP